MRSYEIKNKIVKLLSCFIPNKDKRCDFRDTYSVGKYELDRKHHKIGEYSYMSMNSAIVSPDSTIGKFTSIGREVLIGTSSHPINRLTTHPLTYTNKCKRLYGDLVTPKDKIIKLSANGCKPVTVGNDVWIGARAIIMDGIKIGDGAIIGANSVVTKDVPPYAIVAGCPAKLIRYRFSEDVINKLLELCWWDYPKEFIVNNLPFDDVEECIKILSENRDLVSKK